MSLHTKMKESIYDHAEPAQQDSISCIGYKKLHGNYC